MSRFSFTTPGVLPGVLLCASLALGASFAFAPAAHARPEMAGLNVEERFAGMDADKNGQVSREEFFAAQPQMKEAAFDAIDADKDGAISLQEWAGFSAGHGKSDPHADESVPQMPPASGAAPAGKAPELIMPPAGNT